jgi:hypothetical protein
MHTITRGKEAWQVGNFRGFMEEQPTPAMTSISVHLSMKASLTWAKDSKRS